MTIILYGTSPYLDKIETALRKEGGYAVLRLSRTHIPERLNGLSPGMIIYDPQQVDPVEVNRLSQNYPGWKFVGLTEADDRWMLRNGKKYSPDLDTIIKIVREILE